MKNSRPAYSLIFAFIIVTVLLLVAVSTIKNTNDKIIYYKDLEGGSKAYLAAQSAVEDGILAMKDFYAGFESSDSGVFTQDLNGDGTNETYADFEIFAKAQNNDNDTSGLFYIPIPGTGDAGEEGDCSILDDVDAEVDDPCNWNKLLYGQSVTIPLYTDDGAGNLLFPYDLSGFNGWSLKVRTPCDATIANNDDPETCTRYELSDGAAGSSYVYASDDSVLFWQITGEGIDNSTGADYTVKVIPDDEPSRCGFTTCRSSLVNTEIYESKINTAASSTIDKYIVLKADKVSTTPDYSDLYYACMGDTDSDTTTGNEITLTDLSLQLDIVTPLKQVTTENSIPYLEWQLTIDSLEPFADNKSVIVGKGYYQGTEHTFYYPYVVNRSTTGESSSIYTLSN
jgi:hypothetical protein